MLLLSILLAVASDSPTTVDISIVGTADLHGRVATLPLLGGYLDALRAARPKSVVLVDGGDMFQGTLESDMNEGETVIRAYTLLGYDAVTIGNHEFDYGPVGPKTAADERDEPRGALRERAKQAQRAFPFLAANLMEEGMAPKWDNVRGSTVAHLANGVNVGIIGVTTVATPETTIAANFVRLSVTPIKDAIVAEAAKVRAQGADIVVVTAHAGGRCEKFEDKNDLSVCDQKAEIFELARALHPGTVDVIVAGHVHAGLAHEVNGIAIIESFAQGKAFGRVDLQWDSKDHRVRERKIFAPKFLKDGDTYEGHAVTKSTEIERVVAPAIARAEASKKPSSALTPTSRRSETG
jgi:2',3'-cyclic-nucleotide 2'-phosphodiesterase (5'-nucleotidase family)